MTWPPTVGDDLELVKELATHPNQPIRETTEIRAPCCDKKMAADMVVDLTEVSEIDVDYLCDACRDYVFRDKNNVWTWAKLMQKLDAPWEEVRAERAKEKAQELRREARDNDEWFNPQELRQKAFDRLPNQARDILHDE